MPSPAEKLINLNKAVSNDVKQRLIADWEKADTVETREAIHAQVKVLDLLTKKYIQHIRGTEDG